MLIAKLQIAHQPSIYVLDTPGVLVPSFTDIVTRLKLALADTILLASNFPLFVLQDFFIICLVHVNMYTCIHSKNCMPFKHKVC